MWHIGDVIRKVRETRGWSRKELVAAAKIRPNTLGQLEAGQSNFAKDTLGKVAAALDVAPERLWQQIPHAPEACVSAVTSAVTFPDDDQTRTLASVWRVLSPDARQHVITAATFAALARGEPDR